MDKSRSDARRATTERIMGDIERTPLDASRARNAAAVDRLLRSAAPGIGGMTSDGYSMALEICAFFEIMDHLVEPSCGCPDALDRGYARECQVDDIPQCDATGCWLIVRSSS